MSSCQTFIQLSGIFFLISTPLHRLGVDTDLMQIFLKLDIIIDNFRIHIPL